MSIFKRKLCGKNWGNCFPNPFHWRKTEKCSITKFSIKDQRHRVCIGYTLPKTILLSTQDDRIVHIAPFKPVEKVYFELSFTFNGISSSCPRRTNDKQSFSVVHVCCSSTIYWIFSTQNSLLSIWTNKRSKKNEKNEQNLTITKWIFCVCAVFLWAPFGDKSKYICIYSF